MGNTTSFIRIYNAMLRYYFKMPQSEIDQLSDAEWAMYIKDLEFIRLQEAKEMGAQ